MYRPPDQTNFYELFESLCLDSALFNERECVVLGDLNTNMLGNRRCNLVKSLSAFLDLFNWTQIIKDQNRVTTTTSSTIDLILVSNIDKISQSGVIDIGISDHSLIFCTRKQTKAVFDKHNSVKLRSLKHYNREEFQMNLRALGNANLSVFLRQYFAVVRQINPELDSTVRLFFIATTVNKMTTDQCTE